MTWLAVLAIWETGGGEGGGGDGGGGEGGGGGAVGGGLGGGLGLCVVISALLGDNCTGGKTGAD